MKISVGIIKIVLLAMLLDACVSTTNTVIDSPHPLEPFAVSYEKISNRSAIAQQYKLLIVESDQYTASETDSLTTSSNEVLAYISLGEVDRNRWYYPLLEERGFLGVNENWDSPYLNLADSVTRSILLDQVVPKIMEKGYNGLFLDTVDNVAPYTERAYLQPYMLELIEQIRERYPDAIIMQNAGLFLLDQTQYIVDAVLLEDIATLYDFENSTYNLRSLSNFRARIDTLEKYQTLTQLPFFVIDFADTVTLQQEVVDRLSDEPYPYFIGRIELNDISTGISSGAE